jgi:hypothetical protein
MARGIAPRNSEIGEAATMSTVRMWEKSIAGNSVEGTILLRGRYNQSSC